VQNAAGGGAIGQSEGPNESYHSIVSELDSLIEHIQASMKLLEPAIASETAPGSQQVAANVVVLDDVTPRYATVNAVLSSCNAGLGVALPRSAGYQDRTTWHGRARGTRPATGSFDRPRSRRA
jgi:hypothetical protein